MQVWTARCLRTCEPEALRPEGALPEDASENEAVEEDHDPVSQDVCPMSRFGSLGVTRFWEELLTQIMATPPLLPDELLTPPRLPCYSRRLPSIGSEVLAGFAGLRWRLPSRSRSPCRALCRLRRTCLGQKPRRQSFRLAFLRSQRRFGQVVAALLGAISAGSQLLNRREQQSGKTQSASAFCRTEATRVPQRHPAFCDVLWVWKG